MQFLCKCCHYYKLPVTHKRVLSFISLSSQRIIDAFPDTGPPPEGCEYPSVIDDLYVCARYTFIDGFDRVLASARPTFWRTPSILTMAGEIRVDTADVPTLKVQGNLKNIVLHELGHILGTVFLTC